MSETLKSAASRREFLKKSAKIAAASALAGIVVPHVHAGEDNTIRLALIGCGGRGTGAVGDAMNSKQGPVKLFAMADVFEDRLTASHKALAKELGDRIDVPKDRQFIGFDAYKKAIDCLRPGDVAILTTYCGFRPLHFEYAVQKGVNVFMEKNLASDTGGIQRFFAAGETADKKNLKVAVGLMCRHSSARHAMINKIRDGAMGQIELIRTYRMNDWGLQPAYDKNQQEVLWQIRHPQATFWYSGGCFVEWTVHLIDECCWLKDSWPIEAHGVGGRVPDSKDAGQSLDSYSVEYTFADGTKAMAVGRYSPNCYNNFATYVHGSKCAGQFSGNIHAPTVFICKDQRIAPDNVAWKPEDQQLNPYWAEWAELLGAIRNNKNYNETKRSAYSCLAMIMGQAAVHTGRIITWQEAMASSFEFCPNPEALTADGPAPVHADAQGRYPAPVPGQWKQM